MKTGFKEHFAFGLLALVPFFALASSTLRPSLNELFLSSCLFLFSSVFPDIDSPFSYVRRGFRVLLTSLFFLFALALAFFFHNPLAGFCPSPDPACFWASLAFTLILPFILVELIDWFIPGHRGPLHSLSAGFLFAVFIYALSFSSLAGLFAFAGFLAHLFLDFAGSRF